MRAIYYLFLKGENNWVKTVYRMYIFHVTTIQYYKYFTK